MNQHLFPPLPACECAAYWNRYDVIKEYESPYFSPTHIWFGEIDFFYQGFLLHTKYNVNHPKYGEIASYYGQHVYIHYESFHPMHGVITDFLYDIANQKLISVNGGHVLA